jgi:hypothetical protein
MRATAQNPVAVPLLEIKGLQAGYGEAEILHGIGLSMLPGEFLCIIGANTAGKSTILRSVSKLFRALLERYKSPCEPKPDFHAGPRDHNHPHCASSSRSAFASFRSRVSNPSANRA